jgi:outer membrane protein assembly factor BamB
MNDQQKIALFTNLRTGSAIVCSLIAFLLLLSYFQLKRTDPLESTAMTALLERLEEEPGNQELKEEIRNLDLLARKAFFNRQWQMNTGAVLLLLSALVFGFSLNALDKLQFKIEKPAGEEERRNPAALLARRGVWIGGAAVVLVALGATFLTRDQLQSYQTKAEESQAKEVDSIEVIELVVNGGDSQEPGVSTTQTGNPPPPPDSLNTSEDPEITDLATSTEPADSSPEATIGYPGIKEIFRQHATFRGPMGNGVSFHQKIPTTWNEPAGQNIIWKVSLPGTGNNSPIIWGNQLFIAASQGNKKSVLSYNRYSGALLWQRTIDKVPGSPPVAPKVTDDTGLSAPTLCTDGVRVYAIFATGDVAALDMEGKVVWARNLGLPDNHYGHSSSLVCWQGKLFVQYDTNRGAKVLALDCSNGETIWETKRNVRASWASPLLASVSGTFQVILSADPLVAGYHVDTGEELWSVNCMMGEVGPSAAYGGGLVFAANEYAKLVAIRPEGAGTIVWESDEYLPEVSSPVTTGELLYVATSYGVIACYDTKTGGKYWEHEGNAGFYASPVIADGKLYVLDRQGMMYIFQDAKEKQLLGQPFLGEATVATPAFANGKIYIRGEKHLYCIGS